MVSFMVKYKNILLLATILFFVGSLGFVGMGVFIEEYGPNAPVAYVGKTKIKVRDFETSYRIAERNMRESGPEFDEDTQRRLRQEVLQALINEESLFQSARKYGIGISDLEVGYDIKSNFSGNGMFNKQTYIWIIRNQLGMNPEQYEAMVKKQKLAEKFKNALILSAKVTPQEAAFFAPAAEPKDKKSAKAAKNAPPAPDEQAIALAVMEIKAQSLANSFTQQFNAREKVELKNGDKILAPARQYSEYED